MNQLRHGLPLEVVRKITAVFARYPQVKRATLYGSRAKGNFKRGSDIDLTLHGDADLTLNVTYRILDELDDLLLPYTIDLSIFHMVADPDVIYHIQRVGVSFYVRDTAVAEHP